MQNFSSIGLDLAELYIILGGLRKIEFLGGGSLMIHPVDYTIPHCIALHYTTLQNTKQYYTILHYI